MTDITRWRTTWHGLGVTAPDESLCQELIARYSEPHRHYHTMQHLDECFARLDEARDLAERIHEVELARWFHDAVYGTRNQDNEAQSAEWARTAEHVGLPPSVGESVYALILCDSARARRAMIICAATRLSGGSDADGW